MDDFNDDIMPDGNPNPYADRPIRAKSRAKGSQTGHIPHSYFTEYKQKQNTEKDAKQRKELSGSINNLHKSMEQSRREKMSTGNVPGSYSGGMSKTQLARAERETRKAALMQQQTIETMATSTKQMERSSQLIAKSAEVQERTSRSMMGKFERAIHVFESSVKKSAIAISRPPVWAAKQGARGIAAGGRAISQSEQAQQFQELWGETKKAGGHQAINALFGMNPVLAMLGAGAVSKGGQLGRAGYDKFKEWRSNRKAEKEYALSVGKKHSGGVVVAHGGAMLETRDGRRRALDKTEQVTVLKEGEMVLPTHQKDFMESFASHIANAVVKADQINIKNAKAAVSAGVTRKTKPILYSAQGDYFEDMEGILRKVQDESEKGLYGKKGNASAVRTVFSHTLPMFGSHYKSELPRIQNIGLMAGLYKLATLQYVHSRFASKEVNDLLMQQSKMQMAAFGVKGSLKSPKARTFTQKIAGGIKNVASGGAGGNPFSGGGGGTPLGLGTSAGDPMESVMDFLSRGWGGFWGGGLMRMRKKKDDDYDPKMYKSVKKAIEDTGGFYSSGGVGGGFGGGGRGKKRRNIKEVIEDAIHEHKDKIRDARLMGRDPEEVSKSRFIWGKTKSASKKIKSHFSKSAGASPSGGEDFFGPTMPGGTSIEGGLSFDNIEIKQDKDLKILKSKIATYATGLATTRPGESDKILKWNTKFRTAMLNAVKTGVVPKSALNPLYDVYREAVDKSLLKTENVSDFQKSYFEHAKTLGEAAAGDRGQKKGLYFDKAMHVYHLLQVTNRDKFASFYLSKFAAAYNRTKPSSRQPITSKQLIDNYSTPSKNRFATHLSDTSYALSSDQESGIHAGAFKSFESLFPTASQRAEKRGNSPVDAEVKQTTRNTDPVTEDSPRQMSGVEKKLSMLILLQQKATMGIGGLRQDSKFMTRSKKKEDKDNIWKKLFGEKKKGAGKDLGEVLGKYSFGAIAGMILPMLTTAIFGGKGGVLEAGKGSVIGAVAGAILGMPAGIPGMLLGAGAGGLIGGMIGGFEPESLGDLVNFYKTRKKGVIYGGIVGGSLGLMFGPLGFAAGVGIGSYIGGKAEELYEGMSDGEKGKIEPYMREMSLGAMLNHKQETAAGAMIGSAIGLLFMGPTGAIFGATAGAFLSGAIRQIKTGDDDFSKKIRELYGKYVAGKSDMWMIGGGVGTLLGMLMTGGNLPLAALIGGGGALLAGTLGDKLTIDEDGIKKTFPDILREYKGDAMVGAGIGFAGGLLLGGFNPAIGAIGATVGGLIGSQLAARTDFSIADKAKEMLKVAINVPEQAIGGAIGGAVLGGILGGFVNPVMITGGAALGVMAVTAISDNGIESASGVAKLFGAAGSAAIKHPLIVGIPTVAGAALGGVIAAAYSAPLGPLAPFAINAGIAAGAIVGGAAGTVISKLEDIVPGSALITGTSSLIGAIAGGILAAPATVGVGIPVGIAAGALVGGAIGAAGSYAIGKVEDLANWMGVPTWLTGIFTSGGKGALIGGLIGGAVGTMSATPFGIGAGVVAGAKLGSVVSAGWSGINAATSFAEDLGIPSFFTNLLAGAGKGAMVGAVIGGIVGVTGGPAGIMAGAFAGAKVGAIVGTASSQMFDLWEGIKERPKTAIAAGVLGAIVGGMLGGPPGVAIGVAAGTWLAGQLGELEKATKDADANNSKGITRETINSAQQARVQGAIGNKSFDDWKSETAKSVKKNAEYQKLEQEKQKLIARKNEAQKELNSTYFIRPLKKSKLQKEITSIGTEINKITEKQLGLVDKGIISAADSLGSGSSAVSGTIPAFAKGGVAKGGISLVGEQGPELISLPIGTRVMPAYETKQTVKETGIGGPESPTADAQGMFNFLAGAGKKGMEYAKKMAPTVGSAITSGAKKVEEARGAVYDYAATNPKNQIDSLVPDINSMAVYPTEQPQQSSGFFDTGVGGMVKGALGGLWDMIKSLFGISDEGVDAMFGKAKSTASSIFSSVSDTVSGAAGYLGNIVNGWMPGPGIADSSNPNWMGIFEKAKERLSGWKSSFQNWVWPPTSGYLTSRFKMRDGAWHKGVDIASSAGTPIQAIGDGTIYRAGSSGGMGNFVEIAHPNGLISQYMHMLEFPQVKQGAPVSAGDIIGHMGSTGKSTGNHLHFGLVDTKQGGANIDPQFLLGPLANNDNDGKRWSAGALTGKIMQAWEKTKDFASGAWGSAKNIANISYDKVKQIYGGFKKPFVEKLNQISGSLGIDPAKLLAMMHFETGGSFRPDERNSTSGATGLIQFMPDAPGLDYKTIGGKAVKIADLARMTAEEQLDYVYQYLAPYASRIKDEADPYMAVLSPANIGRAMDDPLINGSNQPWMTGTTEYSQNSGLDLNKDGRITKREASHRVLDLYGKYKSAVITPAEQKNAPTDMAGIGGPDESMKDLMAQKMEIEKSKKYWATRGGHRDLTFEDMDHIPKQEIEKYEKELTAKLAKHQKVTPKTTDKPMSMPSQPKPVQKNTTVPVASASPIKSLSKAIEKYMVPINDRDVASMKAQEEVMKGKTAAASVSKHFQDLSGAFQETSKSFGNTMANVSNVIVNAVNSSANNVASTGQTSSGDMDDDLQKLTQLLLKGYSAESFS